MYTVSLFAMYFSWVVCISLMLAGLQIAKLLPDSSHHQVCHFFYPLQKCLPLVRCRRVWPLYAHFTLRQALFTISSSPTSILLAFSLSLAKEYRQSITAQFWLENSEFLQCLSPDLWLSDTSFRPPLSSHGYGESQRSLPKRGLWRPVGSQDLQNSGLTSWTPTAGLRKHPHLPFLSLSLSHSLSPSL